MAFSNEQLQNYFKRLGLSRLRILNRHGFYGLLLMHVPIVIDEKTLKASTDGKKIFFNPRFLDTLSDGELDFVMMHEILHIALRHPYRCGDRCKELFDWCCDVVVNSNILYENDMQLQSIRVNSAGGIQMHVTPTNEEGYKYTAEEVYAMLNIIEEEGSKKKDDIDDHSCWGDDESDGGGGEGDNGDEDLWTNRIIDAAKAIDNRENEMAGGCGDNRRISKTPDFVKRMLEELTKSQTDWRTLLSEFVQEEFCDYSFSPPDRRFGDLPFFLPDFNETEETVKNILFMVDTSASMSDKMITEVYSEVRGAIEQFGGRLCGWIGFFDAQVIEPVAFESVEELEVIRAEGGGGTDFDVIFEYVNNEMADNLPNCVIILTDGGADFTEENPMGDIPVLWIINNEEVTPPWGKISRIKTKKGEL